VWGTSGNGEVDGGLNFGSGGVKCGGIKKCLRPRRGARY